MICMRANMGCACSRLVDLKCARAQQALRLGGNDCVQHLVRAHDWPLSVNHRRGRCTFLFRLDGFLFDPRLSLGFWLLVPKRAAALMS